MERGCYTSLQKRDSIKLTGLNKTMTTVQKLERSTSCETKPKMKIRTTIDATLGITNRRTVALSFDVCLSYVTVILFSLNDLDLNFIFSSSFSLKFDLLSSLKLNSLS